MISKLDSTHSIPVQLSEKPINVGSGSLPDISSLDQLTIVPVPNSEILPHESQPSELSRSVAMNKAITDPDQSIREFNSEINCSSEKKSDNSFNALLWAAAGTLVVTGLEKLIELGTLSPEIAVAIGAGLAAALTGYTAWNYFHSKRSVEATQNESETALSQT